MDLVTNLNQSCGFGQIDILEYFHEGFEAGKQVSAQTKKHLKLTSNIRLNVHTWKKITQGILLN